MPSSDSTLGTCYLDPQTFLNDAVFFGANTAVAGLTSTQVTPLLAIASREIDAFCSRTFLPGAISEQHKFNPITRRVSVNQPPVMSLTSYQIQTAPGQISTFNLNSVLINNEENYLELASLALASSLITPILTLGILEPQVLIQYTSYQTVSQNVATACGFIAAKIANEMYVSGLVPDGLTRVRVGGIDVLRRGTTDDTDLIPPHAKLLLRTNVRIAIG